MNSKIILDIFIRWLSEKAEATETPLDDLAVDALRTFLSSDILSKVVEHLLGFDTELPEGPAIESALVESGVSKEARQALEEALPGLRSVIGE